VLNKDLFTDEEAEGLLTPSSQLAADSPSTCSGHAGSRQLFISQFALRISHFALGRAMVSNSVFNVQ
jgi:hypothetical protein